MQILGKRSKVMLIALCAVMLIALGISFAAWDSTAVKADGGNMSDYANAKVGDIVTFGRYYDYEKDANGNYVEGSTVIDKYPMTWIVVDKNERTGQLTLMSQYIIACGSYFGNYYINNGDISYKWNYNNDKSEVAGIPYNQAYSESTLRAYLNNLERMDMGGDSFDKGVGYVPSAINSTIDSGLFTSIGFSNQRYWTGLYDMSDSFPLYQEYKGFYKRNDNNAIYYQRPLDDEAYLNRPMARGFYDEAFNDTEKAQIVPKTVAGYIGHRWPDSSHTISTMKYVNGVTDKVWAPSAAELNIVNGKDWTNSANDSWTNSSDGAGSTVFEYFKNYSNYKNPYDNSKANVNLEEALKAYRTAIAANGMNGNYSIPIYKYQSNELNTEISMTDNTSENYWTRSPSVYGYSRIRIVGTTGKFGEDWDGSGCSQMGVRPCITLQY